MTNGVYARNPEDFDEVEMEVEVGGGSEAATTKPIRVRRSAGGGMARKGAGKRKAFKKSKKASKKKASRKSAHVKKTVTKRKALRSKARKRR